MSQILGLILLLAADGKQPTRNLVPDLVKLVREEKTADALKLLREIGKHKGNHEEAAALVKFVRASRPKKPPEIFEASFLALKGIGSRKVTMQLIALFKHSRLKKEESIRRGICIALGGAADPRAVDTLIDRMRDPDDHVKAAAVEAAGSYRYAKESIRKELVEKVVGVYVPTWNMKESINPDHKQERQRNERKWEVIAKPCERTLELLTNTKQEDPPAWRRWWNKNKNDRWAEIEG
jgi:HEAT repeat protein